MNKCVMTEKEFINMHKKLLVISAKHIDSDEHINSNIQEEYSLSSITGQAFYEYLTDEMLLDALLNRAKELGTSPSQKDMYWVWKDYIKRRFKKWPNALKLARLPTSAGKDGMSLEHFHARNQRVQELLDIVREQAIRTGRIPHPKDVPYVCDELKKHMENWGQVIKAAGVQDCFLKNQAVYFIDDLEDEYKEILSKIKEMSFSMRRPPLHNEVERELKLKLISRCSSWRNALYQIGLEPVMRITPFASSKLEKNTQSQRLHKATLYDCYYQVLNPSTETIQDLKYVQNLEKKLKQIPAKKDVPADIVERLIISCGSWSNALFQLKYLSGD